MGTVASPSTSVSPTSFSPTKAAVLEVAAFTTPLGPTSTSVSSPLPVSTHVRTSWQSATAEVGSKNLLIVKDEKAALALDKALLKAHKNVVFLEPEDILYQREEIAEVLAKGGTFVVHLDHARAAQQLVQLNGLFGTPADCFENIADKDAEIRIIGVLAEKNIDNKELTRDFMSRFQKSYTVDTKSLPKLKAPQELSVTALAPITGALEVYLTDRSSLRVLLRNGFAKALAENKPLVLKHPPSDEPLLRSELQKLRYLYPNVKVTLQVGFDEKAAKNKTLKNYTFDSKDGSHVVVVNQANFKRLFMDAYANNDKGHLVAKPSILSQQDPLPRLRLSKDLSEQHIDFILSDKNRWVLECCQELDHPYLRSQRFLPAVEQELPQAKVTDKSIVMDIRSQAYNAGDFVETFISDGKQTSLDKGPLVKFLEAGTPLFIAGLKHRPDLQALFAGLRCEQPHMLLGDKIIYLPKSSNIYFIDAIENTALPKAVVDKKADPRNEAERLIKLERAVCFLGSPGSGKSYTAEKLAKKLSKQKIFVPGSIGARHNDSFLATLRDWAKAQPKDKKDYVMLVVDEANIAEEHYWEILRSVFMEPAQITLFGENIRLTPQHKIIFTGNNNTMAGRNHHALIDKFFVNIEFSELTPEQIRQEIIKPYVETFKISPKIVDDLMSIHAFYQDHYKSQPASVRSLKNCLVRLANGDDFITAVLAVYGGYLNAAEENAFKAWLELRTGTKAKTLAPQTIKDTKITVTSSVQEFANKFKAELCNRDFRLKNRHNPLVTGCNRAMIIEGPPGRGKDIIAQEVLKANGLERTTDAKGPKEFYAVTAGVGFDALRIIIEQAKRVGAVVVVSELNLLPAEILEGEFNDLLTSSDAHPGFMLIGTINPADFSGREPLSTAFKSRVRYIHLDDYSAEEQLEILNDQGVEALQAELIVEYHQNILQHHNDSGLQTRLPTARQLLQVADALKEKVPLKEALEDVYGYYTYGCTIAKKKSVKEKNNVALKIFADLVTSRNPYSKICVIDEKECAEPKAVENQLFVKKFSSGVPSLYEQVTAALAVHFFEEQAKKITDTNIAALCVKMFADAAKIKCGKNIEDAAKWFVKPPTMTKKGSTLESSTSSKFDAKAIGTSALLDDASEEGGPLGVVIGHTKEEYVVQNYCWPDDELISLPSFDTSKIDRSKPEFAIDLNEKYLTGTLDVLPVPTGHVAYAIAKISNGTTERTEETWGMPKLAAGEYITRLGYSVYKTDEKHTGLMPPFKSKEVLTREGCPDSLKELLPTKKVTAKDLEKISAWIVSNTHYCETKQQKEEAEKLYGLIKGIKNGPTLKEFLFHKKGVCYEGANLFAAITAQLLNLPTRLVNCYRVDKAGLIFAAGHVYVEVFIDGVWKKYDPTPHTALPSSSPTPSPSTAPSLPSAPSLSPTDSPSPAPSFPPMPFPSLPLPSSRSFDLPTGRVFSSGTKRLLLAPEEKLTQAQLLKNIQKIPSFYYDSLQSEVLPSIAPSRKTTSVHFLDGKFVYEARNLGLAAKKAPIVLTGVSGNIGVDASNFWKAIKVSGALSIIPALIKAGFKVHALDHKGATLPLTSEEDFRRWGDKYFSQRVSRKDSTKDCLTTLGHSVLMMDVPELVTLTAFGTSIFDSMFEDENMLFDFEVRDKDNNNLAHWLGALLDKENIITFSELWKSLEHSSLFKECLVAQNSKNQTGLMALTQGFLHAGCLNVEMIKQASLSRSDWLYPQDKQGCSLLDYFLDNPLKNTTDTLFVVDAIIACELTLEDLILNQRLEKILCHFLAKGAKRRAVDRDEFIVCEIFRKNLNMFLMPLDLSSEFGKSTSLDLPLILHFSAQLYLEKNMDYLYLWGEMEMDSWIKTLSPEAIERIKKGLDRLCIGTSTNSTTLAAVFGIHSPK